MKLQQASNITNRVKREIATSITVTARIVVTDEATKKVLHQSMNSSSFVPKMNEGLARMDPEIVVKSNENTVLEDLTGTGQFIKLILLYLIGIKYCFPFLYPPLGFYKVKKLFCRRKNNCQNGYILFIINTNI